MFSSRRSWLYAFLLLLPSRISTAGSADTPAVAYRVTASEVRVTFFATDDKNRAVQDLHQDDFAIVDGDRVLRNFRSLTRSDETGLDVVVMIDTSASISDTLAHAIHGVLHLISQTPAADDNISVISFSGLQPTLLCSNDCRGSGATQRLRSLHAAGATPLFDALTFGADFASSRDIPGARRVLILFSDGEDTISKASARDALQALMNSGALLYTVDSDLMDSNPRDVGKLTNPSPGSVFLRRIAEATGGRYFSARADAADVRQAALDDLRASYVVTYPLPNHEPGFHSLRILPKHNLNLQFHCRSGYYYGTKTQ